MPPRITKVKWSALELPFGVRFDEDTGVFNGIPEDGGEYVVPVTVQTNYGKDTKDVLLNVIETYKVYAIGEKAETWSEGAEPDENGFRALNMPKMKCLVPNAEGFGANTFDGSYYCCGIYAINGQSISNVNDTLVKTDIPIAITYNHHTVERILSGAKYSYSYNSVSKIVTNYENTYIVYKVKGNNGNSLLEKGSSIYLVYSPTHTVITELGGVVGNKEDSWGSSSFSKYLPSWTLMLDNKGQVDISYDHLIFGDNAKAGNIKYLLSDFGNTLINIDEKLMTTDTTQRKRYVTELDKRAIKVFQPQIYGVYFGKNNIVSSEAVAFKYLTEDKLLDNNSDNFTEGTIKDAWGNGKRAYVLTDANKLYEYDYSNKTWSIEGYYNAKKVVLNIENQVFILTNDGVLLHKGTAVEGVTNEHNNLTIIFPTCRFKDIEFGANTLVVLRED